MYQRPYAYHRCALRLRNLCSVPGSKNWNFELLNSHINSHHQVQRLSALLRCRFLVLTQLHTKHRSSTVHQQHADGNAFVFA